MYVFQSALESNDKNEKCIEEEIMGWIKCSDRLPQEEENVLLIDFNGDIFAGYFTGKDKWEQPEFQTIPANEYDEVCSATHWMSLPEKPGEE